MRIRKSTEQDVPRMMEIYAHARAFMAAHGNPNQWGPNQWPPEELIRRGIREAVFTSQPAVRLPYRQRL